jgi:AAA domain
MAKPKPAARPKLPDVLGYVSFPRRLTPAMLADGETVRDIEALAKGVEPDGYVGLPGILRAGGAMHRLCRLKLYEEIEAEAVIETDDSGETTILGPDGKAVPKKPGAVLPFVPYAVSNRLADVVEEEVEWLWPGRFPLHRISGIQAQMGKGKSTLMCYLAAQTTAGLAFGDSVNTSGPGSVVILQAEEIDGQDLKPRIRLMGGNAERIHTVSGVVREKSGTPMHPNLHRDVEVISRLIDKIKGVRLLMVDPLGSYISGISGHNSSEVRAFIDPLMRMTREKGIATILFIHPSKDKEREVIDRGSGSSSFAEMMRMYWYYSTHPKNKNQRLLSWIKGNVTGQTRKAIAASYRLGKLCWSGKSWSAQAQEVDDLLAYRARMQRSEGRVGRPSGRTSEAQGFILGSASAWPIMQGALQERAQQAGIDRTTFWRTFVKLEQAGKIVRKTIDNVLWFYPPEAITEATSEPTQTEPEPPPITG